MQRVKQEVTKYNQHSERRWSMRCVCCQVKLPFLTHTHRHQSESRTPVSLSAIVRHPIVIISYSGADYVLRSVYTSCVFRMLAADSRWCAFECQIYSFYFSRLWSTIHGASYGWMWRGACIQKTDSIVAMSAPESRTRLRCSRRHTANVNSRTRTRDPETVYVSIVVQLLL